MCDNASVSRIAAMKLRLYLSSVVFRAKTHLLSVICRHRRLFSATGLCSLTALMVYVYWFTPLPVYVLDRLNLRSLFLPNLTCRDCNNFTYQYIVDNRNFCSTAAPSVRVIDNNGNGEDNSNEIFLLILVATFHANADARRAIRKSWGSIREYQGKLIRTLFVLGRHDDPNYNYQVQYELQRYGDVIQAS